LLASLVPSFATLLPALVALSSTLLPPLHSRSSPGVRASGGACGAARTRSSRRAAGILRQRRRSGQTSAKAERQGQQRVSSRNIFEFGFRGHLCLHNSLLQTSPSTKVDRRAGYLPELSNQTLSRGAER
jgi:hypothetical protein